MNTEQDLLQWLAGSVVALLGWFVNDRVTKMDKEIDDLQSDIKTKADKQDVKDLFVDIKKDMDYIRQRLDEAIDRRNAPRGK